MKSHVFFFQLTGAAALGGYLYLWKTNVDFPIKPWLEIPAAAIMLLTGLFGVISGCGRKVGLVNIVSLKMDFKIVTTIVHFPVGGVDFGHHWFQRRFFGAVQIRDVRILRSNRKSSSYPTCDC